MSLNVYGEITSIERLCYEFQHMKGYDVSEVHDALEKAIEHMESAIGLLKETIGEYEANGEQ